MKRHPASFPHTIKSGSVSVKIYRTKSRGYDQFQVADYSSGRRRLHAFATFADARHKAREVATKTASGQLDVLQLTSQDRLDYLRSLDLLKPHGIPLVRSVERFTEALNILDGDHLIEAARLYSKRNPKRRPQRTVQQVVDELLKSKEEAQAAGRTIQDLRYRLGKFAAAFGCNIGSVSSQDVQAFLDALKLSAQSYLNFRRVIGTLFRFAVRRGYLPKDFEHVEATERRRARGGTIAIYTPDEIRRLLVAAPDAFKCCLAIQAFAGLRSAEMERLDWRDVRLEDDFIEVAAHKSKTASRRLAPVLGNLKAWLAPYAQKAGLVWPNGHDAFYDCQQSTAAKTATKDDAQVEWKANALRHSFISYRLAAVQNVNQVALECGNSPSMIFKHYRELVRPVEAVKWFAIKPSEARQ